jgi:hypothetical protein
MSHASRGRSVPPRRRSRAAIWMALTGVLLIPAIAVLYYASGGRVSQTLIPDHTVHDFGQVAMSGGEISARIPITVRDTTRITSINSS